MQTITAFFVGLTSLLSPPALRAQEAPPTAGPSFMVVRYSTAAALTFYGGYQVGKTLGFVGLVQNPRNNYREALLGAGRTWSGGGRSILVGTAAAYASDGWYLQLYLLPTLRITRAEVSGTLEVYQPLEHAQAHQFYTTPLNAFYLLSSRAAVGVTYLISAQARRRTTQTLGPSIRVNIPSGSIRVDWQQRLAIAPSELRVTLTTAF
ncbi:MAG: hypothetical protein U0163_07905 [Gemmatimonadaceae bacterium]